MKHLAAVCIAISLSSPAAAEDETMTDLFKQFEDLSKNAQTLLESWMQNIAPKLEELGPTLENLAEKLGDLNAYHPQKCWKTAILSSVEKRHQSPRLRPSQKVQAEKPKA